MLVLNSGSSSLKFAVHDTGSRTPLMSGLAERLGAENPAITLACAAERNRKVA
jgi:acetate kinase